MKHIGPTKDTENIGLIEDLKVMLRNFQKKQ